MTPVLPPPAAEPTHRPFDMADYLDDANSQAVAFSEVLESGHQGVILDTLAAIVRARGISELDRQ